MVFIGCHSSEMCPSAALFDLHRKYGPAQLWSAQVLTKALQVETPVHNEMDCSGFVNSTEERCRSLAPDIHVLRSVYDYLLGCYR